MSDIGCAVHICSILHQRYSDFAPNLMENWQKYMLTKKDEKVVVIYQFLSYSKICVKRPVKNRQKEDLNDK